MFVCVFVLLSNIIFVLNCWLTANTEVSRVPDGNRVCEIFRICADTRERSARIRAKTLNEARSPAATRAVIEMKYEVNMRQQ